MDLTPRRETWTWEAYLDWEARQDTRHELVDGEVVAMDGGTVGHDTICVNLVAVLRERVCGGPCRAHGSNLKIRAGANGRYPDASVDCGPRDADALVASAPAAVFEVLSPGTSIVDTGLKLRDYERVTSIMTYALLEARRARILVHRRDGAGLFSGAGLAVIEGLEASLALPELGIALPLAALYEGVAPEG